MSASSFHKSSALLLGLALLVACDRAPEAVSTANAGEPASKTAAKPEAKPEAPKPVDAVRGADAVPAVTSTPAPAPAVAGEPAPAPAVAEGAIAEGLSVVTHKVIAPARTGDSKEDYWTQYQVWGEITNHSSEVMEAVSGTITFHDASGAMIGIDSIGTAIKQDFGDSSPGETVRGAVHFVQPGQTVPFHFMRNLDAIISPRGAAPPSPTRPPRAWRWA
jgi:hypothetical protein